MNIIQPVGDQRDSKTNSPYASKKNKVGALYNPTLVDPSAMRDKTEKIAGVNTNYGINQKLTDMIRHQGGRAMPNELYASGRGLGSLSTHVA